ncbi:penicillin acylase family protein [Arcticibacterium luteifluviistationis]|uniref:Peptidase S45 n=1 Tax=Arcticibacterium luteifluviistationis TaxID=1784714 RepID=A0A2Z4GEN7_9BACT|nr:penicillin acylase family protein [Arcticibacterium luteifluviistationis]AWV99799.1 peptidase S45 [Arcticibacterium luteifluviistationis]
MKNTLLLFLIAFSSYAQINTANIQIARDQWGVPHIFGKTDPEVAYGLAWAHAEDDFKTIQLTLLAGKGMLGKLKGKDGAAVDYVVGLLKTQEIAKAKMHTLSPEFTALAKGYLAGLNRYASLHPEEVLVKNSFPISMNDYVSSLILSLSVISGADGVIKDIYGGTIEKPETKEEIKGSNAFAFSSAKTTTGETFLNINSHQPLEGPVAWYEAHLQSEEGWNMLGGLFPGGCVIFHGVNENLGWAHTVNHQDKIDVYKLEMKSKNSRKYLFDGVWRKLEKNKVKLKVNLGWITLPIGKKAYWSEYGATLKTKGGVYSIRMGANQDIRGVEQWYKMNKATSYQEFHKAMEMVAIPGFNTVYADNQDNIFFVSNGKIPIRNPQYDWSGVLPGNTSETLWSEFHPLEDLPQYLNPKSGYLFNSNNTVFNASAESDNLNPEGIDPTMGYPLKDNNRSMRFVERMKDYHKLTYDDFKSIKYDGQYPAKFHFPLDINIIWEMESEKYPEIAKEIELLQNWNRKSDIENTGAGFFAILAYEIIAVTKGFKEIEVLSKELATKAIQASKEHLMANFGTTEVALGEVQKLVRGEKAIPLPGLPDVLAAMYTSSYKDGMRKGMAGESYIQLVRFKKNQMPEIETVINYGASNHPESPHYADQMEMFVNQKTKRMTLNKTEVLKNAERVYSPK